MKTIILIASLILIQASAFAGTVIAPNISADATPAGINQAFTAYADVINGNIEGSTNGTSVTNIKSDSIYEINMADDANPRVRDSEIFNITTDSVSGGSLTQGAFVESGGVPATDSDLTSDVSACVAYVNGYRVSKGATAQTYTASRDTYLDLSQTGVYTQSAVTIGATQPAVAANSVRLAKVVTDGTTITTVTSLYTTRVPGLIIPSHYRDGLFVSRDSTTTITILPGSAEINSSIVSKTATSTLTIGTAGDWAGGTSLRAADTFGFVGMDTSGNLKLHTTAPTHDNYAVSTTVGKKRYATWSSTVYRILGWFYMDGASSALVQVASNIKDGNVPNQVLSQDPSTSGVVSSFTTASLTDVTFMNIKYYSSGYPVKLTLNATGNMADNTTSAQFNLSQDVAGVNLYAQRSGIGGTGAVDYCVNSEYVYTPAEGKRTFRAVTRAGTANNNVVNGRTLAIEEL